jgi:hypothetical protein
LCPFARSVGFTVRTIHLATLNLENLQAWVQGQLVAERLCAERPAAIAPSPTELADVLLQSRGSWRTAASLLHRWLARRARQAEEIGSEYMLSSATRTGAIAQSRRGIPPTAPDC